MPLTLSNSKVVDLLLTLQKLNDYVIDEYNTTHEDADRWIEKLSKKLNVPIIYTVRDIPK